MSQKMELFKIENDTLDEIVKKFDTTVKSLNEDVDTLMEWMKNQPHLPEVLPTRVLQNFLLLNKCSVENTKKKIDMYYSVRTKFDDIYGEINPKLPHMRELSKIAYLLVYPERTEEMYTVSFMKLRNKALLDKLTPCNVQRQLLNIQEIRMRHDIMFRNIFILDCDGLSMSFVLKLTPTYLYKVLTIAEKVFSTCLEAYYIVNFPPAAAGLMSTVKKILKAKLFERVHIFSDARELKDYIPINLLPKDYGGEGMSCEELQDIMDQKFDECQDMFDHLDTLEANENLRPEKLRNDDVLGFHGNFKRLDLD